MYVGTQVPSRSYLVVISHISHSTLLRTSLQGKLCSSAESSFDRCFNVFSPGPVIIDGFKTKTKKFTL